MKLKFEISDTFCGETNGAQIRRGEKLMARYKDLSERRIVLEAKKWAGWSGHHCTKEYYGDTLALRPRGINKILFIEQED